MRSKIIYSSHWVFVKAHLIFLFNFVEFTSHLTKVFSWLGWSCRPSVFSEQNVILNRKQSKHSINFKMELTEVFHPL